MKDCDYEILKTLPVKMRKNRYQTKSADGNGLAAVAVVKEVKSGTVALFQVVIRTTTAYF